MKKDDGTGRINYDCNVCSRVGKFVERKIVGTRKKIIGMLSLFALFEVSKFSEEI